MSSEVTGKTKLPLEGIRVIDMTVVWAGPFANMILGDMGAEIVRVESLQDWIPSTRGIMPWPPKEFARTQTPLYSGFPNRDPGKRPWNRFPIFNCHARNKLSMTVDLKRPKGMEIFKRLVKVSDVMIESSSVEVMQKRGITYEALKQIKPDFIMARMPGLGLSGPYAGYRAYAPHVEALNGHTLLRSYPDMDSSVCSTVFVADFAAGATVVFAVIAALHYRNRTGKGQVIESALSEAMLPFLGQEIMDTTMNGRVWTTTGNRDISAAPCGCYPCAGQDRWINITVHADSEWEGFCRALGNPAWANDEIFSDSVSRWKNQDALDIHVKAWTCKRDPFEVMYLLQKEGVPCGVVKNQADGYSDPQLLARGFFEEVTHEDCGTHHYPGMMFKFSKTPLSIRKPPVRLGEDNEYVYKKVLGVSDEEYKELEKEGHIGMDFVGERKDK